MDTLFELSHYPADMSSWLVLMLMLVVRGAPVLIATGLMAYALRRSSAADRYLVRWAIEHARGASARRAVAAVADWPSSANGC